MPEQIENRMVVDSEWEQHERKSKTICSCDECGEDIYPGEIYYKIDGDCICEDCIVRYMNKNYKVEAYEN